jgi:N-acyl-D-aspartate/D-glutamate deacylase
MIRRSLGTFKRFLLVIAIAMCVQQQAVLRSAEAEPKVYDVVLRGGTIHRGDGGEPQVGDIGIEDGKIARIAAGGELQGDLQGELKGHQGVLQGELEIDCKGLVVAPGFIDLHNHSDDPILDRDTRLNANYLLQGCTTIVTGNCGSGHVDVGTFLDKVDKQRAGTHVAHLIPQGSLRKEVLGSSRREPTEQELAKMLELADKGMRDGAFGMSTGLIYVPGTFTSTEELIKLAKVVAKHQGIYASHIRSEGAELLESIDEAVRIGREAGLPVHISHLKASGKSNWGSLRLGVRRIEEARASGLRVTADQYPYTASSTSLEATLFPDWSREGGNDELKKRLSDPEATAKIRKSIVSKLADSERIQLVSCEHNRAWIGKSLDEVAALEKSEPADIAIRIQQDSGASVINFGMNEDDMRMAMPIEWVATASDGGAKVPTSALPHPRSFGTFPRKIGRYAIGEKVLTLAQAIRSSSSLPADILGLTDRGRIAEGLVADIAVFDPKSFQDQATFESPYLPNLGIVHVLVGGRPAVYAGQVTGVLSGKALRKAPRPEPAG